MRVSLCLAAFLFTSILFTTQISVGIANDHYHEHYHLKHSRKSGDIRRKRGSTVQIAGSRLPDCMHACGSCSPCRLVTVSSVCASLSEEAESCPVSYRCMCSTKSYPIP